MSLHGLIENEDKVGNEYNEEYVLIDKIAGIPVILSQDTNQTEKKQQEISRDSNASQVSCNGNNNNIYQRQMEMEQRINILQNDLIWTRNELIKEQALREEIENDVRSLQNEVVILSAQVTEVDRCKFENNKRNAKEEKSCQTEVKNFENRKINSTGEKSCQTEMNNYCNDNISQQLVNEEYDALPNFSNIIEKNKSDNSEITSEIPKRHRRRRTRKTSGNNELKTPTIAKRKLNTNGSLPDIDIQIMKQVNLAEEHAIRKTLEVMECRFHDHIYNVLSKLRKVVSHYMSLRTQYKKLLYAYRNKKLEINRRDVKIGQLKENVQTLQKLCHAMENSYKVKLHLIGEEIHLAVVLFLGYNNNINHETILDYNFSHNNGDINIWCEWMHQMTAWLQQEIIRHTNIRSNLEKTAPSLNSVSKERKETSLHTPVATSRAIEDCHYSAHKEYIFYSGHIPSDADSDLYK